MIKLFLTKKINSVHLGMVLPQKAKISTTDNIVMAPIQVGDSVILDPKDPPVDFGELYPKDKLFYATPTETVAYYKNLFSEKLVPQNCYWFYIQEAGNDGTIQVKSGHLPVYHFGINKFFSGRVSFDWSRSGGTVYRIE